jgi:excisionase family DNA binding protein
VQDFPIPTILPQTLAFISFVWYTFDKCYEPLPDGSVYKLEKKKGSVNMRALEHEPLTACEQHTLEKIAKLLIDDTPVSLLVGSEVEAIELPKPLLQILKHIIHHMTQDNVVYILRGESMLSTQEAADILDASRPYVVKLLDEGKIPFTEVGVHQQIRIDDLMKFKKQMEKEQEEALNEITRISQELGLYD